MKICDYLPRQFVVAGTDTGVGKTLVAALLAAGLDSAYWKPIQSGLAEESDTEIVRYLSCLPASSFFSEAYRFAAPISPHASAAMDGEVIEIERLSLPKTEGRLIVEGAGGVMVPLNDDLLLIDVVHQWGLPVLLVARSRVGTINHTLLTLAALRSYGIAVLGVVMNGGTDTVSRRAIERYGKVKVLTEVPFLSMLERGALKALFAELFVGEDF